MIFKIKKMFRKISGIIQIIILVISLVQSFPDGAPLEQCGAMFPGHGVIPIESESPFSIFVEPNFRSLTGNYKINQLILNNLKIILIIF